MIKGLQTLPKIKIVFKNLKLVMPHVNGTKYFKNNVIKKVPQISTKLMRKFNKLNEEVQRKRKKKYQDT